MNKEIEILETKLYILKKINKILKGKYKKEIEEIEKEIEEWKNANEEIWKENE